MNLELRPDIITIRELESFGIYDHISIYGKHNRYDINFNESQLDVDYIHKALHGANTPTSRLNSKFKDYDFYKLYMYVHGGVSVELAPSCRFDSGLYGVIAIAKSAAREFDYNRKRYNPLTGKLLINTFIKDFNKALNGDYDTYSVFNEDYEYVETVNVDDIDDYIKRENAKGNSVTFNYD